MILLSVILDAEQVAKKMFKYTEAELLGKFLVGLEEQLSQSIICKKYGKEKKAQELFLHTIEVQLEAKINQRRMHRNGLNMINKNLGLLNLKIE